jgi:O-glycosyl hydrolase
MLLCLRALAMFVAVAGAADGAPSPIASTVSASAGQRLQPQPPLAWTAGACPTSRPHVHLHADKPMQTMGGFGASMTESSAINLNSLPTSAQQKLLELLYGPTGVRFSAMKATMLSNDFAAQAPWSTYDDSVGDVALTNFSIARDLRANGSLTLIKRALAAGFAGTIQAYMDYPPDWMLIGKNATTGDNGTVRVEYYDVLAHYYAKYVSAYADHGVHIDFLECFNEPYDSYTDMSPTQLATFLGKHVGPLFSRLGLHPRTKLTYGGQAERFMAADFVPKVIGDAAASRYMDVIAYHGYDCQFEDDGSCTDARQNYSAIASLYERYPSRPLWMTEICYAYNGDDPNCTHSATMKYCTDYPRSPRLNKGMKLPREDFGDGATWGHRIVEDVKAGASGWIYWNLLLNQDGGPFLLSPGHADAPGNWQHPVVVVDGAEFRPTGLFYFLGHFSKFVRPGARRLPVDDATLPEGISTVAFRAPTAAEEAAATPSVGVTNGRGRLSDAKVIPQTRAEKDKEEEAPPPPPPSMVVQLVNKGHEAQTVAVCSAAGDHYADMKLPAVSITTAQWSE